MRTSTTLLMLAVAYLVSFELMTLGRLSAADLTSEFDLPDYEDIILVPVMIGRDEYKFLLDSGASVNAFDMRLRPLLGESVGQGQTYGPGGAKIETEVFRTPEGSVGSVSISKDAPVALLDLSIARWATGQQIDGILGMPMFLDAIVQIDFDSRKLRFLPKSAKAAESWGRKIDVDFSESNLPIIAAKAGDLQDEAYTIDTGSTEELQLRTSAYSDLLRRQLIAGAYDQSLISIGGERSARMGRLSRFQVVEFAHNNLSITEDSTNVIGLGYFRQFMVTFDLRRGRLYLCPGEKFNRPNARPFLGLALRVDGPGIKVTSVTGECPAAKAGVEVGDILTAAAGRNINGYPIAKVMQIIFDELEKRGEADLELLRKDQPLKVTLRSDPPNPLPAP